MWVTCPWWRSVWAWRAGGRAVRSRRSARSHLTSPTSGTSPAGSRCTPIRSTSCRCPCAASTPASREWVWPHTQNQCFSLYRPSAHVDSAGFRGSRTAGHRRRAFPNLKTKAGFWFSGRLRKKNCWLSNAWDSFATAAACPWPSTRRRRREGKSRPLRLSWHFSVASAVLMCPSSCRCIYTLYLMSDSYLGLDQQYDLHLNIIPASIAAQVNSEISESTGRTGRQWPHARIKPNQCCFLFLFLAWDVNLLADSFCKF